MEFYVKSVLITLTEERERLAAGHTIWRDALFADLRVRTPDDVWLYNSAGFSYAGVSDHCESARWFREGIDVAVRTGDPTRSWSNSSKAWRPHGRRSVRHRSRD
jgi:hypothetical protein